MAYADLELGDLETGAARPLTPREINALRARVGLAPPPADAVQQPARERRPLRRDSRDFDARGSAGPRPHAVTLAMIADRRAQVRRVVNGAIPLAQIRAALATTAGPHVRARREPNGEPQPAPNPARLTTIADRHARVRHVVNGAIPLGQTRAASATTRPHAPARREPNGEPQPALTPARLTTTAGPAFGSAAS